MSVGYCKYDCSTLLLPKTLKSLTGGETINILAG